METENHFYVTLPSNSRSFPNNTLDDFRVLLPRQIRLTENWEVALAEITYPHTWHNIRGNNFFVLLELETYGTMRINLPPNYYASVDEVCATLNQHVSDWLSAAEADLKIQSIQDYKIEFNYDADKRKVLLTFVKPELFHHVAFSQYLGHVLGFEIFDTTIPKNGKMMARYPIDLDVSFVAMYVYCDLLPNLIVGDTLAPLLRTVNVEGNHDDIICRTYDVPHYLPLS